MAGDKTEKATPKRKQDERKKGNVFLSKEVVTVFSLIASFYAIELLSPFLFSTMYDALSRYLQAGATQTEITTKDVSRFFVDGCLVFAKTAMPLLVITSLITIIITMAQTKMLFSAKAFAFKGERINPLSGLKKMFSMRSLVELLKSVLKIIILGAIIYSVFKAELSALPRLMDMGFVAAMAKTGQIIMSIVTKAAIVFAFVAAGDYLYQWWEYEKNLRMSKQELKDEYKQTEGDPQIKGRLRSMQQQKSRQRMMQNVPQADVVIRNPTHYAVAICFDQTKDRAPHVVAKGADQLALRIIHVAEEHGVYITEDRPLARALYKAVAIDQEIPEQFYQPIAQVLAFVYTVKKKDLR